MGALMLMRARLRCVQRLFAIARNAYRLSWPCSSGRIDAEPR